ncbi:unnamed protein product [Allacma fusca]|uniref:Uncharacterized protein n=1 Tax=Allacma fusca TaxID=39272 RepID=A0A8J2LR59_9HEXA|nr:unnamed protein product [Allacma fusca]
MDCCKQNSAQVVSISEGDVLSVASSTGLAREATMIAKMMVNKLPEMEPTPVESFWQDSPVVMIYFRRWG